MGQKTTPKDFRMKRIYSWDSKWFSVKNYAKFLKDDFLIRRFLEKKLKEAAVDKILIERSSNSVSINILTAKPGFIIGRSGSGIEELKNEIKQKYIQDRNINLNVNVQEVSNPATSAAIVSQTVVHDLEKRMPYRRVMKQALERVEKGGAKGVKISVSGRLNGSEIARTETLLVGKIPLHTIRADIDYSFNEAFTTYGKIGVKVWIYKGEIFENKEQRG